VKRYIIPGILAALLTVSLLLAPTYTYVVRELSQTMTGIFTFGAGMNVTGGNANLSDGQKLNVNGSTGNEYIVWDSTSHQVQTYVDGNLRSRVAPNGVIPGDCPDDLYSIEGGTVCYDPATGKRMTLDWRGLHEVGQ
jgi:hypothetical protein